MAVSQKEWLKEMRNALRPITIVITRFSSIHLPDPSMDIPLATFRMLHKAIPFSPRITQLQLLPTDKTTATRNEHTLFITEFTALLEALVPHLDRLGTRLSLGIMGSSIGTSEEAVFWELWNLLVAANLIFCSAGQTCPELWPEDKMPFYAPLYAALFQLLRWLLSISRSPAWLAMTKHHGLLLRNREVAMLLTQPVECLNHLWSDSPELLFSHINQLPASFVPLICCIFTEVFGTVPLLVPNHASLITKPAAGAASGTKAATHARGLDCCRMPTSTVYAFLPLLRKLINNLTSAIMDPSCHAFFPFLTSTAVLQVLKVVINLPIKNLKTKPELVGNCVHILNVLLGHRHEHQQIFGTGDICLSLTNRQENSDKNGLPLHMNARLSRAAFETDRRLLHALGTHIEGNILILPQCCETQHRILEDWMRGGGKWYYVPAAQLAEMLDSTLGLAKQCSSHALRLMLQLLLLQKGHVKLEQLCSKIVGLKTKKCISSDDLGAEGMKQLRALMYAVSHSQFDDPGKIISRTGDSSPDKSCRSQLCCLYVC